MTNVHETTMSARAGAWLGRVWRSVLKQETRAIRWLVEHGTSPRIAKISVGLIKWVLILAVASIAFWLAFVAFLARAAATLVQQHNSNEEHPVFEPTDPHDHRQRLFYDPLTHNDTPDPRFEDD